MPNLKDYRRVYSGDAVIERIQDSIVETFRPFTENPVFDCQLMENLTLETAYINQIEHKLGRQPRGWYIVDSNVMVNAYRNAWSSKTIDIVVTADCIVNMVVF